MKSITSGPGKAKDRENDQSYGLDADQGFFCGIGFWDQWHQVKRCLISQKIMNHGQHIIESMLWFQILVK